MQIIFLLILGMRWLIAIFPMFLVACGANDSIKIKGSDTEVNLAVQLAEAYRDINNVPVSVSGGGSGLGIASLYNGNADIANSSRRITREESVLFEKRSVVVDSFVFAEDAIAFVVSSDLPLDSISVNDLAQILSGQYQNWSSVSKADMPITIYGRQGNSGTHDYVQKKLHIRFSPYAKQLNGNAQILEAIKNDMSGIGYVGAGYVMNERSGAKIKVLLISGSNGNAISPLDIEQVNAGAYYFQRPLYQYYRKENYRKVKPFLDFEKTEKGRVIILRSGYYLTKNKYGSDA